MNEDVVINIGDVFDRVKVGGNPFEEPKKVDTVTILDIKDGSWKGILGTMFYEPFVLYSIEGFKGHHSSPMSIFKGSYVLVRRPK